MSPPASERAEQTTRDVRTTPHLAPQPRGADGAARHPYHRAKHMRLRGHLVRWDTAALGLVQGRFAPSASPRKDLPFFGHGLFVSWNEYRFYAESPSRQQGAFATGGRHARRWGLAGARAAVTIPAIPPPRRFGLVRRN